MGGPIFDFINALASGNFMAALATLGAMAVLLFICFPIHEYAHAWAANKLGDDTAERGTTDEAGATGINNGCEPPGIFGNGLTPHRLDPGRGD